MPSWDEIIGTVDRHPNGVLDNIRGEYIRKMAKKRGRNVICYYSGWLQDPQGSPYCSLSDSDMEGFLAADKAFDERGNLSNDRAAAQLERVVSALIEEAARFA